MRRWYMILAAVSLFVLAVGPAGASHTGWHYSAGSSAGSHANWTVERGGVNEESETANCNTWCPYYVTYWGGYNTSSSVKGAGGRHLYFSTDPTKWDQGAIDNWNVWEGAGYVPALSWDYKWGGSLNTGELHATNWFYTDMVGAQGWPENDTNYGGTSFYEQFKIRWDPDAMGAGADKNFEVEFWDPFGNSEGEMNFSQYIVTNDSSHLRLDSWFMEKLCFTASNSIYPSAAC
ncbi:hypothetical protein [Nitrolancea hollandica]|uniref:Uncharacterized protein n=1 Tax=Nitrolancea hollandica Lb TaxID=1129897 RepID=I4EKG2_9BACT|nr:hypothetical protein [Nitrolancea hollandica]CCF85174.1 exported hypothetical protein [Nitrolancea hollandica Lb]